jgi:hypothetical protein
MLGQIIELLHQFALHALGLLLSVLCGGPQTPPEPPPAPAQAQLAPASSGQPSNSLAMRFEFAAGNA